MATIWINIKPLRATTRVLRGDVICRLGSDVQYIYNTGVAWKTGRCWGIVSADLHRCFWSELDKNGRKMRLYRSKDIPDVFGRTKMNTKDMMNKLFSAKLNLP